MQPSNEQIVAACRRAGIPIVVTNGLLWYEDRNDLCEEYGIDATNDTCPGSALFIVAVMSRFATVKIFDYGNALPENRRYSFNGYGYPNGTEVVHGGEGPSITAACMAAIVAAYPEQETTT